jgi:hypothetical protein
MTTPPNDPSPPVLVIVPEPSSRLRAYQDRVGLRSYVFQCALATWSAFAVLAWLVLCDLRSENWRSLDDCLRGAFALWLCVAIPWALVAFPLGIAAVATLKRR